MSSGKLEKIYRNEFKKLRNNSNFNSKKIYKGISSLVVPFSSFSKGDSLSDIYDGTKKLCFEKCNPVFKSLLIREFSNSSFY